LPGPSLRAGRSEEFESFALTFREISGQVSSSLAARCGERCGWSSRWRP
jgi:hypothetical protein